MATMTYVLSTVLMWYCVSIGDWDRMLVFAIPFVFAFRAILKEAAE